jgi:hypothetical protein
MPPKLTDADFWDIERALGRFACPTRVQVDSVWDGVLKRLQRKYAPLVIKRSPVRTAHWHWRERRRRRAATAAPPVEYALVEPSVCLHQHMCGAPWPGYNWKGPFPRIRETHVMFRAFTTYLPMVAWPCLRCGTAAPPSGGYMSSAGTYNVGGSRLSVSRFVSVVALLADVDAAMRLWVLTEFRPTAAAEHYANVATNYGFVLFFSAHPPRGGGGGIGILMQHRLAAACDGMRLVEAVRGHCVQATIGRGGGGVWQIIPVGRFHVHVMFRAFTTYLPIVA